MGAVESLDNRLGRLGWISLAFAFPWSVALLVAALVAPTYQVSGASSSGTAIQGSATLVEVNGWGVLLAAGVPLLATVVVGGFLWNGGSGRAPRVFAWMVTGLLAGFNVVALLSIGVFAMPVTVALVVVCASQRGRPDREVGRSGLAA